MQLENILSTFPLEIRESPAMKGLAVLIHTLQAQLQKTQEQLTKAEAKIQVLEEELSRLRKTPKRPKFRPNGMQPRNRNNCSPPSCGPEQPMANASLVQKEVSEVKIKIPKISRTFS
jgi:chromosome segregation ATPase